VSSNIFFIHLTTIDACSSKKGAVDAVTQVADIVGSIDFKGCVDHELDKCSGNVQKDSEKAIVSSTNITVISRGSK